MAAAWFREAIALRQLQGDILTRVYLDGKKSTGDHLGTLKTDIDGWYCRLTRDELGNVHPYFEVNYHLLIVTLYRPSPLTMHTQPEMMPVLRHSAFRVIQIYGASQPDRMIMPNYATLCHIITAGVCLVYAIIENDGNLANFSSSAWRQTSLNEMNSAEQLISSFCQACPGGLKYTQSFYAIATEAKARLQQPTPQPGVPLPMLDPEPRWEDWIANDDSGLFGEHPFAPNGDLDSILAGCSETDIFHYLF